MSSPSVSYPCPFCGVLASADNGCPGCGRGPSADAVEVIRLNAELAGLDGRLRAARAEVATVEAAVWEVRGRRDAVAARVRAAVAATRPVAPPPAAPLPFGPQPFGPAQPFTAFSSIPAAPERRLTTLTAQNVLFALGGLLLVVAAAVFTAVAWAQVGVAGRATILAAATAAVLAVPPFAVRRSLTGAAETLAAVGLLMILLDGYAAWSVDLLGVSTLRPATYAAIVGALTSAIAFGYGRLVGLPGPKIAALLIVQPVIPLAVHADATGTSLALTGTVAVNIAALHRLRFRTSGAGLVAYVCGFVAALAAALLAVNALAVAGTASSAAAAGGALVLLAAVLTAGAVLAGHRIAQTWTAGLLTVAIAVAAAGWLLQWGAGAPLLRLSAVALVVAVAAQALRAARLPEPVGQGPWIAALGVAAVPALGVAANALIAALNSMTAAQPLFEAPLAATVAGPGESLLPATIAVFLAYVILLPAWTRVELALTALAAVAVLMPAVFGLRWWTAAVLGLIVTALALVVAVFHSSRIPRAVPLVIAAAAAVHASATGLGDPGVAAGVFAAIAVLGVGTALLVGTGPLGEVTQVVGLLACAPAVWLGLFALDVSVAVQVRALFGLTALLGLAARRVRAYEPQVAGVALLFAAATPLWSYSGGDPAQLYVGGSLILVAVLRRNLLAPVVAAVLTAGLLAWTATDLAALVAFDESSTPPVAWATVAAVLMAAVAARLFTSAWTAAPLVALALPLALAAAHAPWPTVPMAQVAAGLAGLVAVVLTRRHPLLAAAFGLLAAIGVGASTARPGTLLAAFALVAVAGAVIGTAARDVPSRIAGWVGGCASLVVVAYLGASDLIHLEAGGVALTVLATAALAMMLEWFLAGRRPGEAPAVTAVAQTAAVIALLLAGSLGRAALIATLWAVVLAVRAVRPGESSKIRFRYALGAAAGALLGWWLFLIAREVGTAELYTAPAAALALPAGWLARRSRPELPSWTAYGPALAAGFLPTLAVIANSGAGDPQYARRLLLGLAGLAVLVAGALARLQAPVICGGIVVVLTALHELAQVWDLVPRWVPLALGGLLLVAIATTLEQRRRDLLRLRDAVGRMS
ncbi:SCO7613 C-terminal domain-containing membrane protein [Actinoplanes sp. HUAS TT8]|uniref:SCO7613 C-terminal domain-containing membrane protein n=1 Tax=Actinoplanes sp. HUAS TT8 TaxID=3447453 RepID=UPI003F522C50